MRGFASIATAYSGLELMVGYPEAGISTGLLPFGIGDTTMAIQAVMGAMAALHHRDRTGEGQFVDVAQTDSSTATLGEPLLEYQLQGKLAGPQGNLHAQVFPHGLFAASGEERWLSLAVRDEREWKALCEVMGRSEWAVDPALATAEGRRARAEEINGAIAEWVAGQERDAAAEALTAAGVPASELLELEERNVHPQYQERDFILEHDFEGFDPCRIYATPWRLDVTPPELTGPTPRLGEHNDYAFKEILGLSEDEIADLKKKEVLV